MSARRLATLGLVLCGLSGWATPASSAPSRGARDRDAETALLSVRGEAETHLRVGRPGQALRTRLVVLGAEMTLDLAPRSHRSEDFRVELRQADGTTKLLDPGPVRTLSGTILEIPGSVVTATLHEDGLDALVELPSGESLWLEPAARKREGVGPREYLILPCNPDDFGTCALGDGPLGKAMAQLTPKAGVDNCANLGGCVAQLLCDTDSAFYQGNNSSATQVQSVVESLVALTAARYQELAIRHQISQIVIRSNPATDPYADPAITTAGMMVTKVMETWGAGTHTSDLVHLFTGRQFSGYAGAAAGIGGVCGFGYQGMYSYTSGLNGGCGRAGIVAHELGHSWGAQHSSGIMQAGQPCTAPWSSQSVTEITTRRDQVDSFCLDLDLHKDAEVISQTVPSTMRAGRSYGVDVTLKNNGTIAWSPVGPSCGAYRLGSANPYNNTVWEPFMRTELPAAVAPGATVTLAFQVTAPTSPGTYPFQRQMVHECVEWFGDPTPNVDVNVTPALPKDAQFVSQTVPTTMTAGQSYTVSMALKNVGSQWWSPVGPSCGAYRLGSANPYNNAVWGPFTRVELPAAVAPGTTVTLNFQVTAPTSAGTYPFQRQMVHECVEWFGDFSPIVNVNVVP